MQHAFWLERWQQNQIGFHNADINQHLQQNWSSLELPSNCEVFVPLCGKTKDLLWLRQQGHYVIAVELSLIAVEAFFTENKLPVKKTQVGEFKLFETDGIQIYCGDFFKLSSDILRGVQAVYDRAALVALPIEMRVQYAAKMQDLLFGSSQILLVAFDYPQHEMQGPPFSVDNTEIISLFGCCNVKHLYSEDISDKEPHFKTKGLSLIHEEVYVLTLEK